MTASEYYLSTAYSRGWTTTSTVASNTYYARSYSPFVSETLNRPVKVKPPKEKQPVDLEEEPDDEVLNEFVGRFRHE